MRRRAAASLALAAVLATLLTGCIPERVAPPPPTGDELAALTELELHLQWQYIGLSPGSPRPDVEIERYITSDESSKVYRDCMEDAGYDNWAAATGAVSLVSYSERLDLYRCIARFPLPPAVYNFYSKAQRAYIYDYYLDQLVPCLRAAGYHVETVPSRGEFLEIDVASTRQWSPFDVIEVSGPVSNKEMFSRCPDFSYSMINSL